MVVEKMLLVGETFDDLADFGWRSGFLLEQPSLLPLELALPFPLGADSFLFFLNLSSATLAR